MYRSVPTYKKKSEDNQHRFCSLKWIQLNKRHKAYFHVYESCVNTWQCLTGLLPTFSVHISSAVIKKLSKASVKRNLMRTSNLLSLYFLKLREKSNFGVTEVFCGRSFNGVFGDFLYIHQGSSPRKLIKGNHCLKCCSTCQIFQGCRAFTKEKVGSHN